jgi:hypothetical protein
MRVITGTINDPGGSPLALGELWFRSVDITSGVPTGMIYVIKIANGAYTGSVASGVYNIFLRYGRYDISLGSNVGVAEGGSIDVLTLVGLSEVADYTLQDEIESKIDVDQIGVTVQPYNEHTVVDSAYVHTDNNYTNTEKSKLAGIEDGATADQTKEDIDALEINAATVSNGVYTTDINVLVQAYNANTVIDANYVHTDNNYTTNEKNKLLGIEAGATADQTASEIKAAYESNLDTNAFTNNDKDKLSRLDEISQYVVKGADYTAANKDFLLCDTSLGPFTITLSSPAEQNDEVRIADAAGTFSINNLIISGDVMGDDSLVLDLDYTHITLKYFTLYGWRIV